MSLANEVINLAPEIGAATGYAVGQVGYQLTEVFGVRRNRDALVGPHARARFAGRLTVGRAVDRMFATMATVAMVAGGSFGAALKKPAELPKHPEKVSALVEKTNQERKDGAASILDAVAVHFAQDGRIDVQPMIDYNNNLQPQSVTPEDLAQATPYGTSQLKTDVPLAMESSYAAAPQGSSNVPGTSVAARSAATVLLLNGETPDAADIKTIEDLSDQEGGQPLYIGDTKNNPALKSLAEKIGGQYYPNIDKANAARIGKQMAADVKPRERKPPTPPSKDGYLIAIGGLLVAIDLGYAYRRFTGVETGDGRVN